MGKVWLNSTISILRTFFKIFSFIFFSGQPNQLGQHILIQQPGGNPILVMQPSAPQTQTIMPTMISTSTGQGTILLQVLIH